MPATSKHCPNGGATVHCDSSQLEFLIANYQANRDLESLSRVVALSQDRAETLIRFYRTTRYKPMDELLSDVNFKLMRAVDKFDPSKGTAFTFVSQVISNVLFTSVSNARKDLERYRKLSKRVLSQLTDTPEDRTVADDIRHRIKANARTTLSDKTELSVQRWYVESFTDDRFESCRHECADAAMVLFPSLSHTRSRELYDMTMVEIRRLLYDDLPQRLEIPAGRLIGRSSWASRYSALLTSGEFTKFVRLTMNLSPFVLFLIDPQSRSRRGDRNPGITRQNLLWILNGHPDAAPLFC